MCNENCIEFVKAHLTSAEVLGRHVIEVGAFDVNGSVRPVVEALGPASYLRVDIKPGPGVDRLCAAEQLVETFGPQSFDIVISTEMIEHIADWQVAVDNLKQLARPGGMILLTTRSRGFPFHEYPHDYWRFEPSDMEMIFADCDLRTIAKDDPAEPGVFVKVAVPLGLKVLDLSGIALYSVLARQRVVSVEDARRLLILEKSVAEAAEELAAERRAGRLVTEELAQLRRTKAVRLAVALRRLMRA